MIDIRPVDPHRRALIVSCAVVVLYWITFAASRLLRNGPPAMPTDISALFLRKLAEAIVAGVVVYAFVWLRRGRATDAMATHAAFDLYGVAAAYALYRNR